MQRQEDRIQSVKENAAKEEALIRSWPNVIHNDIVFECLERYQTGTIWVPPLVCCVCGLERRDIVEIEISAIADSPIDCYPLHVTDPFIRDQSEFTYSLDVIDGAILDPQGFKDRTSDGLVLQMCGECHSALKKHKVPRLSLANRLYRGHLPDEFKDLTWIEEMICAKYL